MAQLIGLLVIIIGPILAAIWNYNKHRKPEFMIRRASGGGKAPCKWLVKFDREQSKLWAQRQLQSPDDLRLAAISVSGPAKNDEVIELCIADGHGNVLYDALFKPKKSDVAPKATEMHGITGEDLSNCPMLKDEIEDIQRACGGNPLLFHNRRFGYEELSKTCNKQNVACPEASEDDLLLMHALSEANWSAYEGHYTLSPLPGGRPWRARDAVHAMRKLLQEIAAD